jgi:2-polyprenyl-3-methyl-5-hydroxy-6-metoxy-1,4-benzoquinol methylase
MGLTLIPDVPGKSSMFSIAEKAKPTKESSKLVDQFAEQLIPCFKDVDHWRWYYETHRMRICFDLDYASQYLRQGCRVLEVGAFPYFLTLPLMSRQYDVLALDKCSSTEYVPAIADNFKLEVIDCDLDIDQIPENDASFDCVVMNEVFEHLRVNLISSMREVLRVLRPGGLLLLSTPNLRSVRGIYNLLLREEAYCAMGGIYENYSYLQNLGVMGHVREYTSKEVRDFLQEIGFEIEGTIYRGSHSEGWLWRLSNYFTRVCPQFRPYFSIVARKKMQSYPPSRTRPADPTDAFNKVQCCPLATPSSGALDIRTPNPVT